MKIRLFALILLAPFFTLKAQTVQSSGSSKIGIEYQCPHDGEQDVNEQTTLIIRLAKSLVANRQALDFSFAVRGEASGDHAGKVIIAGDGQTVIFKPESLFALNEAVHVTFSIAKAENFSPVSYSFRITSMDKETRGQALYQLHQREQAENESYLNDQKEETQTTFPIVADTIAFSPAIVTLDTVKQHEDENIFFTATGMTSPFSFIAIASDTASKSQVDTDNFLFFKNIPIGCGNFRQQDDGTLSYFQQLSSPKGGIFDGFIVHLDQKMTPIDTFQCGNGFVADLHDFHLYKDVFTRSEMMVSYGPRRVFMKEYFLKKMTHADTLRADSTSVKQFLFNKKTHTDSLTAMAATDSATVFDAVIQWLDDQKHVFFQWNSKDYFDLKDAMRDVNLTIKSVSDTLIDYMHINTAFRDSDNNIIASFRHCDEVTKIYGAFGDLIWRLGGKHNQFTFSGIDADDTVHFSHQHDPERISKMHITIFDNGNLHPRPLAGNDTTRVLEYALDEVNHTAKVVWRYMNLPYCAAAGNAQRLNNGNTFIGLGIVTKPSAIEIDPSGNRVFQMSIRQTGAFDYRSYRFPSTTLAVAQNGSANPFSLMNIYPNPAQNAVSISFSATAPGRMQIELLDILGHPVRSISEQLSNAGTYTASLDLHDQPAGAYYCRLSQYGNSAMKMIVVEK